MSGYTDADVTKALEHAWGSRPVPESFQIGRADMLDALEAVAPAIAARALREAAQTIRRATHARLERYQGAPKETASLAIDGTVRLLERLADEAERTP